MKYPKHMNNMTFPSCIHRMAYIQYGNRPAGDTIVPLINNMLSNLTDSKVGMLKKIYLEETRFTRYGRIKAYWDNNILNNEDEKITSGEIRILLYLIEMLCLEDCQQRRKKQLKKMRH